MNEFFPSNHDYQIVLPCTQCVRIRSTASVLLVGGDPTGVELAAEIVYNFPEKKVILAHRGLKPL